MEARLLGKKTTCIPKPLRCVCVCVCVCVYTTCIPKPRGCGGVCVCVFDMEEEYSWMCPRHICQKDFPPMIRWRFQDIEVEQRQKKTWLSLRLASWPKLFWYLVNDSFPFCVAVLAYSA